MSVDLAKYIITTGEFDEETNNIRQAKKILKSHAARMKNLYPYSKNSYGIYMLIEQIKT